MIRLRFLSRALCILVVTSQAYAEPWCYESLLTKAGAAASVQNRYENVQDRLSQTQHHIIRISKGRQLRWMHLPAVDSSQPTFLLLPGVNRGIVLPDPLVAELAVRGLGVASFDFSVQPLSVQTLPEGQSFISKSELKKFDLNTFANEFEMVREQLQSEGVQNIIPVTLSYTGSLSPTMSGFSAIVDIVPMTSWAATNSTLASIYKNLKMAEMFNPFFGPAITRSTMDAAYKSQWEKQVDSITAQFALNKDRRSEMIDGYLSLSRAVEGFSWNLNSLDSSPRVFILAANESKDLIQHQIKTFRSLLAKGIKAKLILVEESGHVIPAEHPAIVAGLLQAIGQVLQTPADQVLVVRPSTKEFRTIPLDQIVDN